MSFYKELRDHAKLVEEVLSSNAEYASQEQLQSLLVQNRALSDRLIGGVELPPQQTKEGIARMLETYKNALEPFLKDNYYPRPPSP